MLGLIALVLLQGVPAFGSTYARKPFFDQAGSNLKVTQAAHCGEEAPGRHGLRVMEFTPEESKGLDWPHDWFHVLWLRNGKVEAVVDLEASYGTCDVFAVDLDGDGDSEVAVEYGRYRGTSAYQRQLELFRRTPNGFRSFFRATLSGYVMTEENGPDGWERSWALRSVPGGFASVLLQLRVRPDQRLTVDDEALDALQFTRREYCWQRAARAYRLCRFVFSKWEK